MQELLFSITYPPIPITQVGPISLSLHGVFAAIGFYFGANHALKLSEEDGADSELFSEALTWAIFGAILGARFFTIPAQWYANCLLYTSPSPRDISGSRMPSSA